MNLHRSQCCSANRRLSYRTGQLNLRCSRQRIRLSRVYLFLKSDGRVYSCKSARYSGFQKHLLTIEVNIELTELGDLAALYSTQLVIVKINKYTEKLLGLVILGNSGLTRKLLCGLDLAYVTRLCKVGNVLIDTSAVQISRKQHNIEQVRVAVEVRLARTLIVLSAIPVFSEKAFCVIFSSSSLSNILSRIVIHKILFWLWSEYLYS